MKNTLILISLVLLLGCKHRAEEPSSNLMIYKGGTIVTMEGPPGETVEAVVTNNQEIVFAGLESTANDLFPGAKVHDLEGKTMMPGFIEQHLHPFLGALTLMMEVIAPEEWILPTKTWEAARTEAEYLSRLVEIEKAMPDPNEILMTWGYHGSFHGELNRQLLDSISSTRPILVWHRSVHEFYLNSAMLEKLGINDEYLEPFDSYVKSQIRLEDGHFFEVGAMFALLPKIYPIIGSEERMRLGLDQMIQMLHSNGITAFNEPGAFIHPTHYAIYEEVLGNDSTPLYAFFIPESKTAFKENKDKGADAVVSGIEAITKIFPETGKVRFFKNHIKLLIDGAIVSQLMMMEDGYLDGHEGEWIQTPEEIGALFDIFWPLDYQIHVHVNGDLGMKKLLEVIEKKMSEMPREDHRTTIVHFANSTEEQIVQLAELGCIISANPYYVTAFADKYSEIGLGPERAQAMVRSASVEKLGIPYSLHSDLPIGPSDPLYLAWCAITRKTHDGNTARADLGLSRHGAMRGITIEAAYSWQMEDEIGSIKKGKKANFTILEENPYSVEIDQLKHIEIWGTVFEGKVFPVVESI